jgi:hypothetical protein
MISSNLPSFMDLYDIIAEAHSSVQDPNHFLFSALNLRSLPTTAHKSGFQTHEEMFIWKRLSLGLSNAVQFFLRVLAKVLASMPQSCLNLCRRHFGTCEVTFGDDSDYSKFLTASEQRGYVSIQLNASFQSDEFYFWTIFSIIMVCL